MAPDVLEQAQRGGRAAQNELLQAFQPTIWSVCRRVAGNDADAADAAQEAMIAILKGLPRFDGRSSLNTWVYRVTTNACLDELRRRNRRPTPGLPAVDRVAGGDLAAAATARLTVDHALSALPEEYRVAVVLRDLCDLNYDEIAQILDIPAGTVRSRIARGRMSLAQAIGNSTGDSQRQIDAP